MNVSAMILHVLQFADRPLSAEEIAAGIVSDFDERPTLEQVAYSLTSSLSPSGHVLVEDGRYRLPEDVPPAQIEEQIASLRLENTSILGLGMLDTGLDGCALSELLERLIGIAGVELDFAYAFHRGHLRRCPHCRDQFPELEYRFRARDAELLRSFTDLLKGFSLIPPPGAVRFAANQAILAETGADPSDWDANAINDPQVESVNHWLGSLASWRTLLLAASIGRELQVYSKTHENAEGVWLDGRRGMGDAQAVEYVRALTDNQFTRILFAEECARMITEGQDIDAALLRGMFASLARLGSREFSFDEFNETYAPLMKFCEPQGVNSDELLSTLLVKALEKAEPDNADGQVETFAELKGMIREIND